MYSPIMPSRDTIDYQQRRAELPMGMHNRDEIRNYFAWQAALFDGFARGSIIDHGAGTGGLSTALISAGHADVTAIEPDPQLVEILRAKFGTAHVFAGTLDDYLAAHGESSVDTIVSSNVLEHIADDVGCLQVMHELLRPGGSVGLYLPARPELFGSLDRRVGHHRRYTKPELAEKLARVGFRVEHVQYRNLVGVLPWLIAGRLLKVDKLGDGSLKAFDRVVFPVARWLEDRIPPAYGLNIVAIATKQR
jgi:SAM-dependent methyltransferase